MTRYQWITALAGIFLVIVLFFFGRTVPIKKKITTNDTASPGGMVSIDSILMHAKERLNPAQVLRVNELENTITRGDVKTQKLEVYHQLAHFWGDTARAFEPYAWYEAEAARLENSEKSLTFAAQLFLENLQQEGNPMLKNWKALQAKDLFERSLKLNPENDSSRVGLGAVYIFGGIAETPMEGIQQILEVVKKDSQNTYGLMTLGLASMMTAQYDKAIERFEAINKINPSSLEAILLLAEAYERKNQKAEAIKWYEKSLGLLATPEMRQAIESRIRDLKN